MAAPPTMKYVGNDIPADKALAQGGEGAFEFSPS
jgi:hypothetical protein